jgi:hypothetical protein
LGFHYGSNSTPLFWLGVPPPSFDTSAWNELSCGCRQSLSSLKKFGLAEVWTWVTCALHILNSTSLRSVMCQRFVSAFCINILHQHFVSTIRINILYQHFTSTFCIDDLYQRFVSTFCIDDLYQNFTSTFCIDDLYQHFVSTICINDLYQRFPALTIRRQTGMLKQNKGKRVNKLLLLW